MVKIILKHFALKCRVTEMYDNEKQHWRNVLKPIRATIKFPRKNELPFYVFPHKFYTPNNGPV